MNIQQVAAVCTCS